MNVDILVLICFLQFEAALHNILIAGTFYSVAYQVTKAFNIYLDIFCKKNKTRLISNILSKFDNVTNDCWTRSLKQIAPLYIRLN